MVSALEGKQLRQQNQLLGTPPPCQSVPKLSWTTSAQLPHFDSAPCGPDHKGLQPPKAMPRSAPKPSLRPCGHSALPSPWLSEQLRLHRFSSPLPSGPPVGLPAKLALFAPQRTHALCPWLLAKASAPPVAHVSRQRRSVVHELLSLSPPPAAPSGSHWPSAAETAAPSSAAAAGPPPAASRRPQTARGLPPDPQPGAPTAPSAASPGSGVLGCTSCQSLAFFDGTRSPLH
mmetsp:Transcript_77257/g.121592  ORF Transcript_77257/g.121592 Transcript_77257/m.121592 type:complete len:231 (-) Transcript_77257:151-843(-)